MPIIIQCPSCNRQLRVPDDLLGRMVKCPTCKTTFTAASAAGEEPESGAAAPRPASDYPLQEEPPRRPARVPAEEDYDDRAREEDYEEDRPRRRRRSSREAALSSVKAPAICLLVTGILGMLSSSYMLVSVLATKPEQIEAQLQQQKGDPQALEVGRRIAQTMTGAPGRTFLAAFAVVGLIIVLGAVMMLIGRLRWLAMLASVLAILNVCCCFVGAPFGIWSLVVLIRPEVRDAFQ